MAPKRSVRLPLQIGTSSLLNLALGAGLLLPGLLAPVWWAAMIAAGGFIGGMVGIFIPFVLAALAIGALRRARRRRASDLLIEPSGVRIDGGRLHGLSFEVKELRAESWRVQSRGRVEVLEIDLPGTNEMVLAETANARERQGFEDLVETIRATFVDAPPSEATVSPHVIRCSNCGGEATPDARRSVPCRYCNQPVMMPADLRAKLERSAKRKKETASSEALLRELLRQPPAPSTNRLLALVGTGMLLVWPSSIATCVALLHAGTFNQSRASQLLSLPLVLILGLFLVSTWKLVDRQTLQLVTLGMGAEAPRRDGEPHHCRSCGGPLPEPASEVLVECQYCGVENVFGFDLRHALGRAVRQVRSLEQALRDRRMRRLAWAGPAVLGALLALAAGRELIQSARNTGIPELGSKPGFERLWVCQRYRGAAPPWASPSVAYACDNWLERSDRVLGRDLRLALRGAGDHSSFRLVVRKIAPGANPEDGTDGAVLVDNDDYSSFVVLKDGAALTYIDLSYTQPSSAGRALP